MGFETTWTIGIVQAQTLGQMSHSIPESPCLTSDDVLPWGGYGLADPFAIRVGGVWFVFFEMFLTGKPNAVIGVASSSDLQCWNVLGVVLETDHHLSYPFVFEHQGEIYMMPESKSVGQVNLYRATDFPLRWERVRTLLNGRLADASMIYYAGRYWIFSCWHSYWLRIFYASSPLGPWKPHWMPIAKFYNKRSVRPGGRPIVLEGQLIRFAQDNGKYYGHQLRGFVVSTLNRLWFSERPLQPEPLFTPSSSESSSSKWRSIGMHHLDCHQLESGLVGFVDGCGPYSSSAIETSTCN